MGKTSTRNHFLIKNMKLEILITILFIIGCFIFYFSPSITESMKQILSEYYSQSVKDGITSFFSITVGIYIAVVTIIATSVIGISKVILQKKLDGPLLIVIISGMAEGIVSVGLSVFIDSSAILYSWVLSYSVIVLIISFIKFIIILMIIFDANLKLMAKSIDADEKYRSDLLARIESISISCRQKK